MPDPTPVAPAATPALEPLASITSFDAFMHLMTNQVMPFVLRVALALVMLAIAAMIAKSARRLVEVALHGVKADVTLQKFFGNVVWWLILVMATLGALGSIGVETTSFAAVLGGASVAIGLAFNDTLANLAAGVLLLVFRPFRVGDTITVAGVTGAVAEIELFTTRLDTGDNRRFIIPNGTVFKANLENVTHNPVRKVEIVVAAKRENDPDKVIAALTDAAARVPERSADRPVTVLATTFGGNIDWQVAIWVPTDRVAQARHGLILAVRRAADDAGIALG